MRRQVRNLNAAVIHGANWFDIYVPILQLQLKRTCRLIFKRYISSYIFSDFVLNWGVDNKGKAYADGKEIDSSDGWTGEHTANYPADTKVLAFEVSIMICILN